MNVLLIIVITISILILSVIFFFLICEHIRTNHTLQEQFNNIDTKSASFSLTTTPDRIIEISSK